MTGGPEFGKRRVGPWPKHHTKFEVVWCIVAEKNAKEKYWLRTEGHRQLEQYIPPFFEAGV